MLPSSKSPSPDFAARVAFLWLVLRISVGLGGVTVLWAWSAAIGAATLFLTGLLLAFHVRRKRMRKGFCDARVEYARRGRIAFGKADFTEYELAQLRRFQRRGDLAALNRFIADSDSQLRAAEAAGPR